MEFFAVGTVILGAGAVLDDAVTLKRCIVILSSSTAQTIEAFSYVFDEKRVVGVRQISGIFALISNGLIWRLLRFWGLIVCVICRRRIL